MDSNSSGALIDATRRLFDAMLGMGVEFGAPESGDRTRERHGITGVIEFTGDVRGSLALSLPPAVARRLASAFTGSEIGDDDDRLTDAVGEMASMLAGGAVSRLNVASRAGGVRTACPAVYFEPAASPAAPSAAESLAIPCTTECGEFTVSLTVSPARDTATAERRASGRRRQGGRR